MIFGQRIAIRHVEIAKQIDASTNLLLEEQKTSSSGKVCHENNIATPIEYSHF